MLSRVCVCVCVTKVEVEVKEGRDGCLKLSNNSRAKSCLTTSGNSMKP